MLMTSCQLCGVSACRRSNGRTCVLIVNVSRNPLIVGNLVTERLQRGSPRVEINSLASLTAVDLPGNVVLRSHVLFFFNVNKIIYIFQIAVCCQSINVFTFGTFFFLVLTCSSSHEVCVLLRCSLRYAL